mgnify:FL=1
MAAGKYTINPRPLRFPIDHSPFHRSKVTFQAMFPRPPGLNIKFKAGVTAGDIASGQFLDQGQEQGFRKLELNSEN